jgi:ankyrin repeat protein
VERHVQECHAVYVQGRGFLEQLTKKIGAAQTLFTQSPKGQMQATFQDTLHLLAWNGYGKEAYKGSMACKQTWTDERILCPKVINIKFNGKTLLSIFAEKMQWCELYSWDKGRGERHLARIKHLLALGADPDSLSDDNWSPLMETCVNDGKSMELFKLLLTLKVNVNGCPDSHWNPLASVASCHSLEKTKLLLAAGADPNFICKGKSVLHLASVFNNSKGEYTECLKLLLKAGANPNLLDNYGFSPVYDCIEKGYIKYAKLMMEYGGIIENAEDLMEAAVEKKIEASIKFLHQRGEPIPEDAWRQALRNCDVPLVAMLLRCGACPVTPINNRPPLFQAVFKGFNEKSLEVMKLLCKAGADVNADGGITMVSIGGSTGSGCLYGGKLITTLFKEYIRDKNKYAMEMIELFISYGVKLPYKGEYQEMLALAERDKSEFIELNRIIMKGRFKK